MSLSLAAMFQTASWRYVNAGENDYGYYTERISETPWKYPLKEKDSKSPLHIQACTHWQVMHGIRPRP